MPSSVYVDTFGNIFIADVFNNRIRKVDASTGIISTVAGTGTPGYSGDSALAINANLYYPSGVYVDNLGNIFIADTYNNVIRKVESSTGNIFTIAGTGMQGSIGDNGLAVSAQLNRPSGIFISNIGDLYIADCNNHRIRKVNSTSGIITTIAGTGIGGYSSDNILATNAKLYYPTNIFIDNGENVFITDQQNNRIRKVTASTGIISTVIGTGMSGSSGDSGLAINAKLSLPIGIYLDGVNNIYITDAGNHKVRRVDHITGIISTIAGTGVSGSFGNNILSTGAQLNYPVSVYVDLTGNVFISDKGNNNIRKIMTGTSVTDPMAGGKCNFISRDSCYSFIGGGGGPIGGVAGPNCICVAAYSGIASGSGNCIAGTNTISNCYANFSFIGGGASNHIGSSSAQTHGSMIGGGFSNTISGYASSILGGKANTVCNTAKWSSVVGGQINKVAGLDSSVLSGCKNISTGNCSVVLGGSGSCDNGFNYAGVFGCNVVAVAANTFHTECLNAVNTPFAPGGAGVAPGGIYWDVVGSAGKALYIK